MPLTVVRQKLISQVLLARQKRLLPILLQNPPKNGRSWSTFFLQSAGKNRPKKKQKLFFGSFNHDFSTGTKCVYRRPAKWLKPW